MKEHISLSLIQSVIDSQKDLIVIFKDEEPILTNSSFNDFFKVSSLQEYKNNFGPILDNFVPHPSYFHKAKMKNDESWFDAVMRLDEIERIVSMMTQNYDPSAFSVNVDFIDGHKLVTFTDITRDLIKRIMIENNVNIDKQSGAYSKKYFLEISKNFEDAAKFNEKLLGITLTTVDIDANPDFANDEQALKEFVDSFNNVTRQDDMLVRWGDGKFLLVYLIDNEKNAQMMTNKLQHLIDNCFNKKLSCRLSSAMQKDDENIHKLIQRADSSF